MKEVGIRRKLKYLTGDFKDMQLTSFVEEQWILWANSIHCLLDQFMHFQWESVLWTRT